MIAGKGEGFASRDVGLEWIVCLGITGQESIEEDSRQRQKSLGTGARRRER
jgi:hypothetical protein